MPYHNRGPQILITVFPFKVISVVQKGFISISPEGGSGGAEQDTTFAEYVHKLISRLTPPPRKHTKLRALVTTYRNKK